MTVNVVTEDGTIAEVSTPSDASGSSYTLPAATSSALGGVKEGAYVANAGESTATDVAGAVTSINAVATQLNALIASLQASGALAASS
ncbi:head fiber protein [Frateuria aurantia]|uniref:Head fiber protein n=1 Tax=Frateuria aurantia (strain ATCC 33424 / DSM 6220 / KCTC 2777 / LMG 1558 / NBRC 3245 / NCIMB 13370) TaxID=767434 RepID=H8L661_FRAAD|nr:head fiber protein [Frateuria aurantia]AFC85905.1 Head fiber protein [Frateuria aurantia DSM 6220]